MLVITDLKKQFLDTGCSFIYEVW